MSYQVDAWLSNPNVQALRDRAHRYRHEVYTTTGMMPNRFLVKEYLDDMHGVGDEWT